MNVVAASEAITDSKCSLSSRCSSVPKRTSSFVNKDKASSFDTREVLNSEVSIISFSMLSIVRCSD